MSGHNLEALARLAGEPGWAGVFTREQAPGAIANGARIVKTLQAPGDAHELGAGGTVLGSVGPMPDDVDVGDRIVPAGSYAYFVEWDDRPAQAVLIASDRIEAVVTAGPTQRELELREVLMSAAALRASTERVVDAMLADMADLDPGDPLPEWLAVMLRDADGWNVGEVRQALRWTKTELAARDGTDP